LWHVGWNCSGAGPPVQFPVIPTEVEDWSEWNKRHGRLGGRPMRQICA
jgi:hypothetical protein